MNQTPADHRARILDVARAAVQAQVKGSSPAALGAGLASERRGAFVTVRVGGELRGCIGHIEADQPLFELIVRCAIAACSADPRFPPLTEAELPGLEVEVSLLGDLEPVTGPGEISVGRDGLLVEQGSRRGLLLPQVATDWNCDALEFLSQTCLKAGLPRDAWRRGARIWKFEAEVIGQRHAAS